MPDDCELAFGKGVRCSVTGDEGGFSFSTFLGVLFTVLGVAPTFGFPAGVDFVSSLPKKDIRLFCFILSLSLFLAVGAIASSSSELIPGGQGRRSWTSRNPRGRIKGRSGVAA